jgi:hypothetical protein
MASVIVFATITEAVMFGIKLLPEAIQTTGKILNQILGVPEDPPEDPPTCSAGHTEAACL